MSKSATYSTKMEETCIFVVFLDAKKSELIRSGVHLLKESWLFCFVVPRCTTHRPWTQNWNIMKIITSLWEINGRSLYHAVHPYPNRNVVQKCTYTKIDFEFGFEDGTWLIFIPLSRLVTRLLLNRATSYVLTRFDVPSWGKWCWIRVRIWCCKMMKLGGEEEEEAYYCNLNAMFRLHYTPLQWMNKVAWNLYSRRWLLCCYESAQFV